MICTVSIIFSLKTETWIKNNDTTFIFHKKAMPQKNYDDFAFQSISLVIFYKSEIAF